MNDIETAQQVDLNRQRQIEAQKQSINRLLEARESDDDTAWGKLIDDLTEQTNLRLDAEAKLKGVGAVLANWGEDARDKIIDVLAGRGV